MQTTVLRVKIYTPSGMPAVGAGVVARLTGVGVSLIDGYIDRSHVEVVTDAQGVAELTLWPSVVGTTGAEYRITARGSDGAKLLDELVTVPESSIEVWLHDIVMLPAPTPKPYDEASIALIQQNRIQAVDAATNAADAAGEAESARQAAELSSQTAGQAESVATASAQEAAASATSAQATTQSALMLFGGLEAVQVAVDSTGNDAVAAAASRDAAEAASVAASSSATTAQQSAGQAQTHAGAAQISANNASAAASAVAADKLAVAADRGAVQGAASQVSADRAVVEAAALTATQAATTSLDRSAGLIAHAENLRGEVDADRVAAETARAGAEALFGDLAAIDEAVQLTYANRAIVDVALTNNLIVLASR